MENQKHITGQLRRPPVEAASTLKVVVIHTSTDQTLAALRAAGSLAGGLGAGIRLIVPQVVPYPAPLEQPPIAQSFLARKFRTIAQAATIATSVEICLARDWEDAVSGRLEPRSVVVIAAGKRRWYWPSKEHRLAGILKRQGHQVVLI